MIGPLTSDRLFATDAFGGAEISRRVFIVTWHLVTAAFATSAAALLLLALGTAADTMLPRFIAAMHASFLVVAGVVLLRRRPGLIARPIPIAFVSCMTAVAVMGWLGAR